MSVLNITTGGLSGGVYNCTVDNGVGAAITNGTFNGFVTNHETVAGISGGQFNSNVINYGLISGGIFDGSVDNIFPGVIQGGTCKI